MCPARQHLPSSHIGTPPTQIAGGRNFSPGTHLLRGGGAAREPKPPRNGQTSPELGRHRQFSERNWASSARLPPSLAKGGHRLAKRGKCLPDTLPTPSSANLGHCWSNLAESDQFAPEFDQCLGRMGPNRLWAYWPRNLSGACLLHISATILANCSTSTGANDTPLSGAEPDREVPHALAYNVGEEASPRRSLFVVHRSCALTVPIRLSFRARGRARPELVRAPNLAEVGPSLPELGPVLSNIGPSLAEVGRTRLNFCRSWSTCG